MTKILIDRTKAYTDYYELGSSRSLEKLHGELHSVDPAITPSYDTLKLWCSKDNWVERCLITDKAVSDGLLDTLVPEWVKIKAELLSILLDQIKKGKDKGIEPENVKDMTMAIKEVRQMVGDENIKRIDLKAELEQPQAIEFVLYDADNVRRDMKTREPTEYQPGDDNQPTTKIMMPDNHREPETT